MPKAWEEKLNSEVFWGGKGHLKNFRAYEGTYKCTACAELRHILRKDYKLSTVADLEDHYKPDV